MKKLLSILLTIILTISCSTNDDSIKETQEKDYKIQNDKEITDYIATKNLKATKSASGLYYVINEQGTGNTPEASSKVTVAYKGYFTDGRTFDSNTTGAIFELKSLIKGWSEGLTYFKEGGHGVLLIPAHLAYGSRTHAGIPPGSVLIFDIKLISINN